MYERILVPIDGSATSGQGLREAIELARSSGGRLRLVHVIDTMSLMAAGGDGYAGALVNVVEAARKAGEEILARGLATAMDAGRQAETALLESDGTVAEQIAAEASRWGADLIVIGSHGRRGMRRMLLGSDAEQVARLAPVPLLLVRDKASG